MRRLGAVSGILTLLATGLSGGLLAGCSEPGGLEVSGPARTPAPVALPVRVTEGPGRPGLSRPATFEIAGVVRLTHLRWRSWGGPVAEAAGTVTGPWCAAACGDGPREARVRFSGRVGQDRHSYYSRVSVLVDGLPPEQHNGLRDLRLFVPERQPRA
ncbi:MULTISPECIES: hypothetical protein [Streptomyces]|uniref:hypothetical protein n=1 Tax=Streptomyces TaxID=1883 RepID=UPI00163D0713|nr:MULTISPECIES: hypothetical protein [Streptomyces]MBC2876059.1 hypothetical protein [Streptomyces sp. TYQ1024]UBI38419.1 hypothetical protein K7I03_19460 [Streptomyces mobaraensis]UKW31004.1 hypothetical protein MCU78_19415 [Streptomyces sp. TYQ1024]